MQDAAGSASMFATTFTLDGTKLIAISGASVLVYHATEGALIKRLKGHKDTCYCLSPLVGGGFASGGADKTVIIWSSTMEGTLKYSHGDTIQSLSLNAVSGTLLSCTASDFGLWSPDVKAVTKTKVYFL